jgi:hypothetical protein
MDDDTTRWYATTMATVAEELAFFTCITTGTQNPAAVRFNARELRNAVERAWGEALAEGRQCRR